MNPTSIDVDSSSIPGFPQWVREVPRHDSDPQLLWLWYKTADTAPIGPISWELPYAVGAALKRKKKILLWGVCVEET